MHLHLTCPASGAHPQMSVFGALFIRVRGRGILRTSPLRSSRKFVGVGCLALHPLEPLRPRLRRLEGLGVVAGLSEHLPVAQLEDEHEVDFPPTTVVDDPLNNPQTLPYQHAAQPGRSRSRVSLLELSHLLAAPETLARLRPLHHVVLVAYLVFRFGTKAG